MPTRWGSTFSMFQRLLDLKIYINNVLTGINKTDLLITTQEWKVIENLIEILKKPAEVTDLLGGEKYITSSLVVPIISQLKMDIKEIEDSSIEIVDNFKNTFFSSLQSRFEETLNNDHLLIASFLNPITKKLEFITELKKNYLIEKINIEINNTNININNNINVNNDKIMKF
jgi:zinc finger BED domain-containing protein 1 (E3 SUMO-protein ligase ZBED1)